MITARRLGLLLAGALLLLVVPIPAVFAKTPPTTTTTAPAVRSPMDEPVGSSTIVNSWAVAPAGQSTDPTQPSERPFLSYNVVPGQVINDAVILYNYSNVPLNFRLYPSDAFDNAQGAFDVLPGNVKPTEVGSWVSVAQEQIALPAKSQARVPVVLHVPNGASAGDHAGGIMASSVAVGIGPDGKQVNVDRRTGTRIYIRVAGPLRPNLSISHISHTYHASLNPFSGRSDITYTITNEGNVRLAGRQRVSAAGLFGWGKKQTAYLDVPELLPGQKITLRASFKGLPATFVDFGKAQVGPRTQDGKAFPPVSRSAATVAMPWTILAVALVIYLIAYARRADRRRKADALANANADPEPQPA